MQFWTHCARLLVHGRIGGFRWWHSLGMVSAGVLMALAVSLRYGELSHFWLAGALVLAGAVGLLWWGHTTSSPPSGGKPEDGE